MIQPLFLYSIAATKMSVCCFYLRVFVGRGMRIATFATISLIGAWVVTHSIAGVLICNPIEGAFDLRLAGVVKCGDQSKFFQSGLSINVVLDAIILTLPLRKCCHPPPLSPMFIVIRLPRLWWGLGVFLSV